MIQLTQTAGALFGVLAVVLGAFGAHALKKVFTPELQQSFETGVRYQMYHALLLILISITLSFETSIEKISSLFNYNRYSTIFIQYLRVMSK